MALYRCSAKPYSAYTDKDNSSDGAAGSHTFTNLKIGKVYLLLVFASANSPISTTRYDGATASGASLTKINNMSGTSIGVAGTFYKLVPSSTTVTVSHSYNFRSRLFMAE